MEQIEQTKEQERIEEFADLRRMNLSARDLRDVPVSVLIKVDFDTKTIWPPQDKLPEGFNPERVLEDAKDPGLGIRELHAQGIDGRGVTVAIIDQTLSNEEGVLMEHEEYASRLKDYKEFGTAIHEDVSTHGSAVSSLFIGKKCGVAPGASLVYRSIPPGRDFNHHADALLDIIEYNKTVVPEGKVRIVSCSYGYGEDQLEEGGDRWVAAIKKAEEEGIVISDVGERTGVVSIGGGAVSDKENIDFYARALFLENPENILVDTILQETDDIEVISQRFREAIPHKIKDMSDENLREKIKKMLQDRNQLLVIPSDYRTFASNQGVNEYEYNVQGGMSWAVPYLSGLFALAWQVNPKLTKQEITEAINVTALTNKNKLKVVNPKGMIEYLQNKK